MKPILSIITAFRPVLYETPATGESNAILYILGFVALLMLVLAIVGLFTQRKKSDQPGLKNQAALFEMENTHGGDDSERFT